MITINILVDELGACDTTPEGEIEEIKETMSNTLKNTKIKYREYINSTEKFYTSTADIYIFDFGGISAYGGYNLIEDELRMLMKKIENSPGKLFIIWSAYTFTWYKDIMTNEYPELLDNNNVLNYYDSKFDEYDAFSNTVRSWLGLK